MKPEILPYLSISSERAALETPVTLSVSGAKSGGIGGSGSSSMVISSSSGVCSFTPTSRKRRIHASVEGPERVWTAGPLYQV